MSNIFYQDEININYTDSKKKFFVNNINSVCKMEETTSRKP